MEEEIHPEDMPQEELLQEEDNNDGDFFGAES